MGRCVITDFAMNWRMEGLGWTQQHQHLKSFRVELYFHLFSSHPISPFYSALMHPPSLPLSLPYINHPSAPMCHTPTTLNTVTWPGKGKGASRTPDRYAEASRHAPCGYFPHPFCQFIIRHILRTSRALLYLLQPKKKGGGWCVK